MTIKFLDLPPPTPQAPPPNPPPEGLGNYVGVRGGLGGWGEKGG